MTEVATPQIPVTDLPYDERRARLIHDALRFNADTSLTSYSRLTAKYEEVYDRGYDERGVRVELDELSLLFSDAWSIVRSLNSIFEIIRRERFIEIETSEKDRELGYAIARVRAKSDHIAGNIGNYARRRNEAMHPMLGILTACFLPKRVPGSSVAELHSVALSHSEFHHKLKLSVFPNDDELFPISGWISHVRLHAFEYTIDLSKAADFSKRLIAALEKNHSAPLTVRLNLVVSMRGTEPFHIHWKK